MNMEVIQADVDAALAAMEEFDRKVWELVPGGRPPGDAADSWRSFLVNGLPVELERERGQLALRLYNATHGIRAS